MVNQFQALDRVFQALADPTRRAILQRLTRGRASVTQLAEPHDMSLPAVVQHLAVLSGSGLVSSEKSHRGRGAAHEHDPLTTSSPASASVYVYDMYKDDVWLSTSLATLEFKPVGAGTRMIFTEQGVFYRPEGASDAAGREQGSRLLLDAVERSLET